MRTEKKVFALNVASGELLFSKSDIYDLKVLAGIAFMPDSKSFASIHRIAISDTNLMIASSDGYGPLVVRNGETGQLLWRREAEQSISSLAFSPDGTVLVVGGRRCGMFHAKTGRLLDTFRGHSGSISDVVVAPDGKTLMTAGRVGCVKFWRLPAIHADFFAFRRQDLSQLGLPPLR